MWGENGGMVPVIVEVLLDDVEGAVVYILDNGIKTGETHSLSLVVKLKYIGGVEAFG